MARVITLVLVLRYSNETENDYNGNNDDDKGNDGNEVDDDNDDDKNDVYVHVHDDGDANDDDVIIVL